MKFTPLLLALGLTLAACGDKEDADSAAPDGSDGSDATDGTDATDGADATDGTDETDGADDPSPSITTGGMACVPATSGPEAIVAQLEVADPQGADTVPAGFLRATRGGSVIFDDLALVCGRTGACTASFRSEDYGTSCIEAPDLVFEGMVTDEDGNSSAWTVLPWEG